MGHDRSDRREKRRYRKILTRMWGDEKFRELTRPKPNGQTLWQYLISGPHTTAVPGLFVAGEAALAESLGWPIAGFRKAWREIATRKMAEADWRARVVWLPNAIRHNAPENPNVVTGWRDTLDDIPECLLKAKACAQLESYLKGRGEAFHEAFTELFVEPFLEGLAGGLANQEQEQEQEQECTPRATRPPPKPSLNQPPTPAAITAAERVDAAYRAAWRQAYGYDCTLQMKPLEFMKLEQQVAAQPVDQLLAAIVAYFATPDPYVRNAKHPLSLFLREPMKYLAKEAAAPTPKPAGCKHQPPCADQAAHTERFQREQRAS